MYEVYCPPPERDRGMKRIGMVQNSYEPTLAWVADAIERAREKGMPEDSLIQIVFDSRSRTFQVKVQGLVM